MDNRNTSFWSRLRSNRWWLTSNRVMAQRNYLARARFQTVGRFIKSTQQLVNNYLDPKEGTIDAIKKLEDFALKHYTRATPLDDFFTAGSNRKRLIITCFVNGYVWLWLIRILLFAFTPDTDWAAWTGDFTFILGKFRISYLIMVMALICTLNMYQTIDIWMETRGELDFLKELSQLKNGNRSGLTMANFKKFHSIAKLVATGSIRMAVPVLNASIGIGTVAMVYMAYRDPAIDYFWPTLFLPAVAMTWVYRQVVVTAFSFAPFELLCFVYLKMRFTQITNRLVEDVAVLTKRQTAKVGVNKIQNRVQNQVKFDRITASVDEHYQVSDLLVRYDKSLRWHLAAIYFGMTVAMDLCLYNAVYVDQWTLKFPAVSIFIVTFMTVQFRVFIMSTIASAAHRPYAVVNSLLAKNDIPVGVRLKLLWFVERLAQKPVGFYCLEMFPFNNNNFLQYVIFWSSAFFLLLELKMKFDLIE